MSHVVLTDPHPEDGEMCFSQGRPKALGFNNIFMVCSVSIDEAVRAFRHADN